MAKAGQSACQFRVSAIAIDKSGKILATAVNHPRFEKLGGGVHAEIKALRKGGPRTKSIVICRVGASGKLRNIDPCISCKKLLDKLGIKIYTIKNGDPHEPNT